MRNSSGGIEDVLVNGENTGINDGSSEFCQDMIKRMPRKEL